MLEALGTHYEPNLLAIIGLVIVATFLGGKLFQRLGIPQVVGYIVTGLFLGSSFLRVVPLELAEQLTFISEIALGLIGFDIGSHLRLSELCKLGRSIASILLAEALGAFFLVTGGVFLITRSWYTAIIFGALSAATDPASTVEVLSEYDAKGPLTTSLLAVVGMDDALALLIFSSAAIWSESFLLETGPPSLTQMVALPAFEIGGAILLGLVLGALLSLLLQRLQRHLDAMVACIGLLLLGVGLSQAQGISFILTAMVLGIYVVNRSPAHGLHIRYTIEQAGPVIYTLFFTLEGARTQVSLLATIGALGLAYVLLRSIGKYLGARLGGTLGRAEPVVKHYLGLLSPGGCGHWPGPDLVRSVLQVRGRGLGIECPGNRRGDCQHIRVATHRAAGGQVCHHPGW
jgi:Kef-type K+ transport system membrane component KefB